MFSRSLLLSVLVCLSTSAFAAPVPAWRHIPALDQTRAVVAVPRGEVFENDTDALQAVDDESRLANDVVRIWSTFPNGTSIQCSGSMVGASIALTAGHCMHNAARGGWATRIQVGAAPGGSGGPLRLAEADAFVAIHSWVHFADSRFDIGLLELDDSIGCEVGWLEPVIAADDLFTLPIVLTGFEVGGARETEHEGRVAAVTSHRIDHRFRLAPGMGGAPLRLAGTDLLVATQGSYLSPSATRVSPQLLGLLERLRAEDASTCSQEGTVTAGSTDHARPAPIGLGPNERDAVRTRPIRAFRGCSASPDTHIMLIVVFAGLAIVRGRRATSAE